MGPGLAFFTVAEAMALFEAQNVMSVLFYVMLFTLGLDSSYCWTETIVNVIDEELVKRGIKRPIWQVTFLCCLPMFLFGLVFVTRKGFQLLDMVDMFVGTVFLLYLCFVETCILNFDYGWKRLAHALKAATIGNKSTPQGRSVFPNWLCRFDFHGTVPLATGFLFFYQLVKLGMTNYESYPMSTNGWGWFLLSLGIAISLSTIFKRDATKLPPIDEDPAFQDLRDAEEKGGIEENEAGSDDELVGVYSEKGLEEGPEEDFIDNEKGPDEAAVHVKEAGGI